MKLLRSHRTAPTTTGPAPFLYGYAGRPPGPNPADTILFRPIPDSRKVECTVCGTRGYPSTPRSESRWQRPHRRGHRPCLDCGQQLTIRLDGTARRHTRCPQAPGPIEGANQ